MSSQLRSPRRVAPRFVLRLEPLLDRLGNANPQLLREVRGRLKPGFVLATLGTSIAGQLFYGLSRLASLPYETGDDDVLRSIYCLGPISDKFSAPSCVKDALGVITVNWPLWWAQGLPVLHWTMLSIAIVVGSYLLIADWSSETDRGTLDPLRLSPQSALSILWGKLLGVPLLAYLFLLSGLPLYLTAMLNAGRSAGAIVGGLAIDLAQVSFWFMTSLLLAACLRKGGGSKAILGAIAVSVGLFWAYAIANQSPLGSVIDLARLISPSLGLLGGFTPGVHHYHYGSSLSDQFLQGNVALTWFGWPIASSMLSLSLFTIGILGAWIYGAWLALVRRFDRPGATLWSKGQSYGITAAAATIVLGTISGASAIANGGSLHSTRQFINGQMPLFWLFLGLGLSLIQSRQTLLDWVRHPAAPKSSSTHADRRDLIWGESSPPWVAFGIHVAIVALILVPYNLLRIYAAGSSYPELGWAFLLLTNLGLLLVGVAQWIQLRARQRAGFLTALTIGAGLFAMPIGLAFFAPGSGNHLFWLLTFYPIDALAQGDAAGALIALVGLEWLGLTLIHRQFKRDLRRLSKGDFAAALSSNPTSNPTPTLMS